MIRGAPRAQVRHSSGPWGCTPHAMIRTISPFLFVTATVAWLLHAAFLQAPPRVRVAKWRGDRPAALSITYDAGDVLRPVQERVRSLVLGHGLQMDYELITLGVEGRRDVLDYMSRRMLPDGFRFYGHGHDHIAHDYLSNVEAHASFSRCFDTMKAIGLAPVAYAYPLGAGHELKTRRALQESGFLSGRTFLIALHRDPFIMPGGAMEPDDWFYLPTLIMMDRTFVAAAEHDEAVNDTAELVPFLDGALDRLAWLILTYHAIRRGRLGPLPARVVCHRPRRHRAARLLGRVDERCHAVCARAKGGHARFVLA